MNYLKKYEEADWSLINPFNRDKMLNKQFENFILKVDIKGLSFKKSSEEDSNRFITYESDLKLQTGIDGYKSSTVFVTKSSFAKSVSFTLQIIFSKESRVYKIQKYSEEVYLNFNYGRDMTFISNTLVNGFSPYVDRISNNKDLCKLNFKSTQMEMESIDVEYLTNSINNLINQDWKEISKLISERVSSLKEKVDKKNNTDKKRENLFGKSDDLSDLLIDLEDMSKSHNVEKIGNCVAFVYNIPGIVVEPTRHSEYVSSGGFGRNVDFTSDEAKFEVNDKLIEVMNAIELFKKRVRDEMEGSIIKVHLKNDTVKVVLEIKS